MNPQHLWLLFLSFVLICISCTTSKQKAEELWDNPIPTPSFIHHLPTGQANEGNSEFNKCLGINESALFESGDSGEAIYRNVQKTIRLTLDGQSVETRVYTDLLLLGRYDNEGNYLGSHGGVDYVCFDLPTQDNGLYLANVQIESTSGKEFEHSWAIKTE